MAFSWRRRGLLSPGFGVEPPAALLLGATLVSTTRILDWQLGLPKVLGIALAMLTVFFVANVVSSRRSVGPVLAVVGGLSAALVGAAIVGLDWSHWVESEPDLLTLLYRMLPENSWRLVEHGATGKINPNELAGVGSILLPVTGAQALATLYRLRTPHLASPKTLMWGVLWTCLSAALIVLIVAARSRSAMAGCAVSATIVGWAAVAGRIDGEARKSRRPGAAAKIVLGLAALCVSALVAVALASSSASAALLQQQSIQARLEVWGIALRLIGESPLVGIGPGQFSTVLVQRDVSLVESWSRYVPHAENLYLTYAVEVGLVGLVAFVWLVARALYWCRNAAQSADVTVQWTGVGVGAGTIAFLVFGLTDAIAAGARGGWVFWLILGMGVGAGQLVRGERVSDEGR